MANPINPNNDFEVMSPPNDSVSAMEFSPATSQKTFLIAGSWDSTVRCWEVKENCQAEPKYMYSMNMPVFDVCWNGDGTKVFMASCNNHVECWDLEGNQTMHVATHDAPVKTCHWVQTPPYNCIMTSSWDKTLKFWDLRNPSPILNINIGDTVCCADVEYPNVVIGTALNGILTYNLDLTEMLVDCSNSPFNSRTRCVSIFKDKITQVPIGFGLGSLAGKGAIFSNFRPETTKAIYSFDCHYRNIMGIPPMRNIYPVNDIKFHPIHGTFATVGSDATFAFWDKDSRTRLKISEILDQPITKCCFSNNGQIFAYSSGFDWLNGPSNYDPSKTPHIFLRSCFEELKPKQTT